jgi:hypothetical protein
MTTMSVQLRSIPDTQTAMGWAEGHTKKISSVSNSVRRGAPIHIVAG